MTEKKLDFLQAVFLELLKEKVFYAYLLNSLPRRYVQSVETAAVVYNRRYGTFELEINEAYFLSLSSGERVAVIEHELLHIVNMHLQRDRKYIEEDEKLWNIACDIAIDQYIDGLPEFSLQADRLNAALKLRMEGGQSAEYYYEYLKTNLKAIYLRGLKEGRYKWKVIDRHDWNTSAQDSYVNGAWRLVWNAYQKARLIKGDVPDFLLEMVERLAQARINWRRELSQSFGMDRIAESEATMKRRDRRTRSFPGKRQKSIETVVIAIDTSGSIDSKLLETFFAEIEALMKTRCEGTNLWLVQCDYKITSVDRYRKGDWKKIAVAGRGGTSFLPVFEELNRGYVACPKTGKKIPISCNRLIYLTDGFGEKEITLRNRFHTLWVYPLEHQPVKCDKSRGLVVPGTKP